MSVGYAVAMTLSFVNAWSGIYSTDTNITAADNQAEIQDWHTMLMI